MIYENNGLYNILKCFVFISGNPNTTFCKCERRISCVKRKEIINKNIFILCDSYKMTLFTIEVQNMRIFYLLNIRNCDPTKTHQVKKNNQMNSFIKLFYHLIK